MRADSGITPPELTSADAGGFFPADWHAARAQFCDTARQNGNRLDAIPINIDDATYPIDIAWHGSPDAEKLVLITSGIHGVEGFAGSAIQVAFMKHYLSRLQPSGTCTFLLVHCINPYGMKNLRRVNENNVDLNRNFFPEGHRYEGVSESRIRIEPIINPQRSRLLRLDRLLFQLIRYGLSTIHAIGEGQYVFRDSLFFGGNKLEQGADKISRYLEDTLKGRKKVVHVDIHIGIGRRDQTQLFQTVPPSPELFDAISACLGKWLAFAHGQTTWKSQSVKYNARGIFNEAVKRAAQGAQLATFTLEFGTKGNIQLIRSLKDENFVHKNGLEMTELGVKIKRRLYENFCMSDHRWRTNVVNRGLEILSNAHRILLTEEAQSEY